MWGVLSTVFSVISVVVFSLALFGSTNLMMFWLFLELGSLSLIPAFFACLEVRVLNSLFVYIVVSSVSSSLIMSGLLFEHLFLLSVLGLVMKFGIFPFSGWVYSVVRSTNWLVLWGLSAPLKSSFLFFSYFISTGWDREILGLLSSLTFLVVALLFWIYTPTWSIFWCHALISSSASFVIMSQQISFDLLLISYLVYFAWSSVVISVLSRFDEMRLWGVGSFFLIVLVLVAFPGSFSLYYKLFMGCVMLSCSPIVLCCWVICNLSEQFFLVKYLVSSGLPRSEWGGSALI